MSRKTFVNEMLLQAGKTHPAAPLLTSGPLLPLIKIASAEISNLCSILRPTSEDKMSWTTNAFLLALEDAEVLFAPWIPLARGSGGRPASKPSHLAWISFSTPAAPQTISSSAHLLRADPAEALTNQLSLLLQKKQSDDSNGHWSAIDIQLCDFPTIFHKTVPPDEWRFDYVKQAQDMYGSKNTPANVLVSDTYAWAFKVFDMVNPVHRIALYTAIIICKMLPNIFNPYAGRANVPVEKSATQTEILCAVRNAELRNVDRNGHGEAPPFIFMVTAYCIAWTYEESPLRKYVKKSAGFGEPWTNKHSKLRFSSPQTAY
ncbi:hypothetical protein EW026_g5023 [Hermanssonia centrifuga]|uniref:Uncharacterized protein n=1 Tax=Hermanssonia centrifuga TaxID=98765 RepID=A0A4S4KFR5_9APHY|nr:hypothetical protein EW026_g5023 [Hermanssonia centrifuga]